jgi:glycosyltransferase involved in cell wall biosynthesis
MRWPEFMQSSPRDRISALPGDTDRSTMTSALPRIMVMIDHYLPGHKVGGPVRSVANMVRALSDRFQFWIVTKDRDWLDTVPYPGIKVNAWTQVERAMVYYARPGDLSRLELERIIDEVDPRVIYLNSCFSRSSLRYLAWRRAALLPDRPVLLSPRGQFSPGALILKRFKKRAYLAAAGRLGLFDGLVWHASSEYEMDDIRRCLGDDCVTQIAPDIPGALSEACPLSSPPVKRAGELRIVFLSRISPKKNLHFLLEMLSAVHGDVQMDIFGPADPESYWLKCQAAMGSLPRNVRVDYRGSLPNDQVAETLSCYHFFVLPTLGENFGHSIFESFSAGCPVLISDQTLWRGLANRSIGWDIPLDDQDQWRSRLRECVDMDNSSYARMSSASKAFAKEWLESSMLIESKTALFDMMMRQ